jgi:hypothetical protein
MANGTSLALTVPDVSPDMSKHALVAAYDRMATKWKRAEGAIRKGREIGTKALEVAVEGSAVAAGGALEGAIRATMPKIDVPWVGPVETPLLVAGGIGTLAFFDGLGKYSHLAMLVSYGIGAAKASNLAYEALRG